nr:hypothetical protein [Tanacetum cinerariifolium]
MLMSSQEFPGVGRGWRRPYGLCVGYFVVWQTKFATSCLRRVQEKVADSLLKVALTPAWPPGLSCCDNTALMPTPEASVFGESSGCKRVPFEGGLFEKI